MMITVVCLCVCRSVCYKATKSIHMHIATNKPGSKIIQIVSIWFPYINMVRINTIIVQICHVCNGHSVNCVHFACHEANNVNNDLALLVREYVVRWLKYYCTFRMTHVHIIHTKKTCTVTYSLVQWRGDHNKMVFWIQWCRPYSLNEMNITIIVAGKGVGNATTCTLRITHTHTHTHITIVCPEPSPSVSIPHSTGQIHVHTYTIVGNLLTIP